LAAVAVARMLIGFWRVWLAPDMPDHRIPNISDAQSSDLNYWLIGSAVLTCSILGLGHWLRVLELDKNTFKIFALGVSLVFFGFHILLLVLNRQTISQAFGLRKRDDMSNSTWSELILSNWLSLSLIYIVITVLAVVVRLILEIPGAGNLGAGMILVVISSLMLYALGTVIIERCFQPIDREDQLETSGLKIAIDKTSEMLPEATSEPDQEIKYSLLRTAEFSSLARRISAVLIIFFAIGSIITLWGIGIFDATSKIVIFWDVILLGFVGYFVYEATRILAKTKIEQKLHNTDTSAGNSNISRLATLLPLFRNFILVAIVAIFLLMILARLGVNIAPLLGGAGVVGIALGFGAQTLVRDIFSGAFFLADDSFRRGEIIDVNQVRGTVEKISIRSMQVRSIDGALHTLPFGDIQMVSNFSRDWAMMKLKLRLTFDTDEAKVRKLLKELGKDLKKDPEIGDLFLQPMKSQGITKMDDSAMIIGVKFKTRPGDQWLARRYVFAKIRELFQSEGIRFANREVTVRLSEAEGDDLNKDTKQKIAGAVLPTLETGAAE
ncbi:MAG: mechanosensitive ion channel family protein, partial [Methyloligellaceae bacterium]